MARARLRRRIGAASAAAVLAGAALLTTTSGALAATRPAGTTPTRTSVLLPTGDAALLTTSAGRTSVFVKPARTSGPGAALSRIQAGKDQYVLPAAAVPFLGTALDPRLFDVTALAKGPSGRVSATIAHAAGANAAVPGFTTTSSTSTTASGYFTASGARAFGTALISAARSAAKTGTAPRTLFGASRISAPGSAGVASPAFQQETQIFRATGSDGAPLAFGIVLVMNTDSAAKANTLAFVVDGEARVSLPVGHYTAVAEADAFDETTGDADVRLLTVPDFTLTTNNQVQRLDFRTATVQPAVNLPKPSSLDELDVTLDREVSDGGIIDEVALGTGSTIAVAPAPAPKRGTQRLETDWHRTGFTSSTPYRYDVTAVRSGAIPSSLVDTFHTGQLATVRERFDADRANKQQYFGHTLIDPTSFFGGGTLLPFTAPTQRTDYLAAPSGFLWQDLLLANPTDDDPFQGFVTDDLRARPAGSTTSDEWMRQLVAQTVPTVPPAIAGFQSGCPACRTATGLTVNLDQIDDAAGHHGYLDDLADGTALSRMRLYRNGTLLDDEPFLSVYSDVPSGAADYTVVADTNAGAAGFLLSTRATTTYTFRSSASNGGALPSGWACTVDSSQTCRILPLLRLTAPLPTSGTGTMATGSHPFTFTLAPIQGAPATTVRAKVEVSFDSGTTFTSVPVTTRSATTFSAALVNPASSAGTTPTLRFTGTDSAGDTITETVSAAYRVASK